MMMTSTPSICRFRTHQPSSLHGVDPALVSTATLFRPTFRQILVGLQRRLQYIFRKLLIEGGLHIKTAYQLLWLQSQAVRRYLAARHSGRHLAGEK